MTPCENLPAAKRAICEGTAERVRPADRAKYLWRWADDGLLPEEFVAATVGPRPLPPPLGAAGGSVSGPFSPKAEALTKPRQDGTKCVHRGKWITDHRCRGCCGGGAVVPVHYCELRGEEGKRRHLRCCDRAGVEGIRDCGRCDAFVPLRDPPGLPEIKPPAYVTTQRLIADTASLVSRIPEDVSAVVGVARSGMLPASYLALLLHRPLLAMTADGVVDCGHGWRLTNTAPHPQDAAKGTVLVVDDTLGSGASLRRAREIARRLFPRRLHCHVYVNPAGDGRPDLFAAWLPTPHILEWNLFNSVYLEWSAYDLDGIFCRDFTPGEDDDGPAYLAALESVRPRHTLPRRSPVHIVTARLEKYRKPTLAWLAKWGVKAASLTMGPWATKAERERDDVAAWKAGHVKRLLGAMRPSRTFGGPLYVEPDPARAERIARLSGHLVVCPAAGRCFGG